MTLAIVFRKANPSGKLHAEKRKVTRQGKTFEQTKWVRNEAEEAQKRAEGEAYSDWLAGLDAALKEHYGLTLNQAVQRLRKTEHALTPGKLQLAAKGHADARTYAAMLAGPLGKPAPAVAALVIAEPEAPRHVFRGQDKTAVEVGAHVWGSRKDRAAGVRGTADDLASLSQAERTHICTKKKLLHSSSVEDLLAQGCTPGCVVLRKALERDIPAAPRYATLESAEAYRDMLFFANRSLDACRTTRDAMDFLQEWSYMAAGRKTLATITGAEYEKVRSDVTRDPTGFARRYCAANGIDPEQGLLDVEHSLYRGKPMVRIRRFDLTSGDLRMAEMGKLGERLKWQGVLRGTTAHALSKGAYTAYRIAQEFDNAQAAGAAPEKLQALLTAHFGKAAVAATAKGAGRWKEPAYAGPIERVGGLPVAHASAQDFIDSFGFTNVQWGEWVSEVDAHHHALHAYAALHDMAEVCDLSARDVTMNGRLALAFGARGSGKACAWYEPAQKIINITKIAGGGSLAHEWAHAFDHLMSVAYAPSTESYKTAHFLSGLQQKASQKMPQKTQEALRQLMEYVDNPGTQYSRHAQALDKGTGRYWDQPAEKLARAFSCFVHDELAKQGRKNTYLVRADAEGVVWTGIVVKSYKRTGPGAQQEVAEHAQPYPHGEDRAELNKRFRELFTALREDRTMQKALAVDLLAVPIVFRKAMRA